VVLVVWGLLLAVHQPVAALLHADAYTHLLLLGAAAGSVLVGAGVWLRRRRAEHEDPDAARAVTDVSLASALAGISVALMLLSTVYGVWLLMIGAGLMLFGLGGVARELRDERRRLPGA
jgi:predicted transporter